MADAVTALGAGNPLDLPAFCAAVTANLASFANALIIRSVNHQVVAQALVRFCNFAHQGGKRMPVSIVCGSCKKAMTVSRKYAGKRVKCPACQASITVPTPTDDGADVKKPAKSGIAVGLPLPAKSTKATIDCPSCGQAIETDPQLAGQRVSWSTLARGRGTDARNPARQKAHCHRTRSQPKHHDQCRRRHRCRNPHREPA